MLLILKNVKPSNDKCKNYIDLVLINLGTDTSKVNSGRLAIGMLLCNIKIEIPFCEEEKDVSEYDFNQTLSLYKIKLVLLRFSISFYYNKNGCFLQAYADIMHFCTKCC